ncbi:DNA repair ATPase [Halomonas dongshanensis]|uniref:DNA repair ATPase n=1 Tax=Halomonas dongshanensis TaxID=2890835 RepID=A0ABT2EG07_9GAMM|nr:DNA repair ATPase [Halomonas dongshanensis]MCS2610485.1 DNA repair ATPase [Halomonas dongshanensis]
MDTRSSNAESSDTTPQDVENLVKESTAFETIKRRLASQGSELGAAVATLNAERAEVFGTSNMALLGRARVRTENNAIARDMVRIGEQILFGFNVQFGLRKALAASDVFALYHLKDDDDGLELTEASLEGSFLTDEQFLRDFRELQQYYSHATLSQLVTLNGKLLVAFQIGEKLTDLRVFRWELSGRGEVVRYIDNRGERDLVLPERFAFAWQSAGRDLQVQGRAPHLNILDTVFVDNLGGNITFKIENNTKSGEGIFTDPVESDSQSLDDATFEYADLGAVVLVRILPFNESIWRYYLFNRSEQHVKRLDAMAGSVVELPENHGLIFPNGYYLNSGELTTFDVPEEDLRFKRMIRSPNGEDVLYAFYAVSTGQVVLYRYNLIRKQVDTPMVGHGAAVLENGHLAIFYAEDEPTLVHPIQVWATPFMSERFHAQEAVRNDTPLGRIGNPELVRGIAELNGIVQLAAEREATERHFNAIIRRVDRALNQFHWVGEDDFAAIQKALEQLKHTAELMLDEYEKVQAIRAQTAQALDEVDSAQATLLRELKPSSWKTPDLFVTYLKKLRDHRGRLMALGERRYLDQARLAELQAALDKAEAALTEQTFSFLAQPEALAGYRETIQEIQTQVSEAENRKALASCVERYRELTAGLDMIQGLISSMPGGDAVEQTRITENLSSIYAAINQQRSKAEIRLREQGSAEAKAQFAAQMRLFEQSLANGVGALHEPEECDQLMTRMLDQLQELESQFGEFDEFLNAILEQRESAHESIEGRRQQLQDARQRRVTTLTEASQRILANVTRRTERFDTLEELHSFFAADAMVGKVRSMVEELRGINANLDADDIAGRLRAAQDAALRSVRDRADIYEEGGNVIRLGPRHRFSVNQQHLDLTLVPRDERIMLHLTGTQYFEPLDDERLSALKPYWTMSLPSESRTVYRAEYLAYLFMAELSRPGATPLNVEDLEELQRQIAAFASPRYREGYEKGIHDHDAALIVRTLWPARQSAGLLAVAPQSRALAMLFWADRKSDDEAARNLRARCLSAGILCRIMQSEELLHALIDELRPQLSAFVAVHGLPGTPTEEASAAEFLARQLAEEGDAFPVTQYAYGLVEGFTTHMQRQGHYAHFKEALAVVKGQPGARWTITAHWLKAYADQAGQQAALHYLPEAIAMLNAGDRLLTSAHSVELAFTVSGLLGQHERLDQQQLALQLDDFQARLRQHEEIAIRDWSALQARRQTVLNEQRERLRLEEYLPKPLNSFVRNKLITESYLPIIGDNLAKQMGTVGDTRRSDNSGLLMMISPPGYGKTTLMEYVANRLGLIFMKINCPSLGHDVTSLDPESATHSTARAELVKLNLAFEMGNNVMLYLDDIQHTHPEFLQKFISLCDGSRRIDGVWNGRTKTYDMRGKRFCIAMAGNPYTESGDVFKVPDMLANRADVYNLGDVLSGMEEVFALSYIENAMSANTVLAPLATRGLDDFYRFVDLARGREVPSTDFEHDYSAAEREEIIAVLNNLFKVREVVLKVNQQYIASSAQDDRYRTEPPFRLQGSYRNMSRLAEKISPILSDAELEAIIDDHYVGEAQLLTQGAEENLLKLGEIRGTLNDEEKARWESIKREFKRRQLTGGDEETGALVVRQLSLIAEGLGNLRPVEPVARDGH